MTTEALWITGPVPLFVVIAHDVFYRIRKTNALENVSADGRVDFHLCKFRFRQLAGLIENVFRDRQFSNVVQERSGIQSLYFRITHLEVFSHLGGIDLRAAHVTVSCLVLRINRDGQGLDRVHMNIGHLLQILMLFSIGLTHFLQRVCIEPIEQMNETSNQQTEK